jgi:sorbitol-specific phosphotransferase system component IIBC
MKGGNDFSQIVLANPTLGPLLLVTYQIIGVLIGVKLPSAIISKTFSTISGLCCL